MNNEVISLAFKSSKEIRDFINSNESGLYSGIDADGVEVVVSLSQGSGMNTRKLQNNGWYIIHHYDEEGIVMVKSLKKLKITLLNNIKTMSISWFLYCSNY